MKMAKKLILASVVLPLVISAGSAYAGGKDRHDECRPGFDRSMMKELNLTDEQKEQLKTLRKANRDDMKGQRKDKPKQGEGMREDRMKSMNELLLADSFDPAKATEMAKKNAQKQIERQVEMMSKQHEMFSILTPDQKEQLIKLQQERMEECGDDMGHHKGKGHK